MLRISSSLHAGALAAVPSVDISLLPFLDYLSATAETTLLIQLAYAVTALGGSARTHIRNSFCRFRSCKAAPLLIHGELASDAGFYHAGF